MSGGDVVSVVKHDSLFMFEEKKDHFLNKKKSQTDSEHSTARES